MKKILLALTATIGAAGSTLAADLPSRKAAPVEYVRICDVYGKGYYYIPGTTTCLKTGGRARAQYEYIPAYRSQDKSGVYSSAVMDTLGWYARAYLKMDARTQTAYGTVRTFLQIQMESKSGHLNNKYTTPLFVGGSTPANPKLNAAFIQFAGFTFGRAPDIFSYMPSGVWGSFFWPDYSSGAVQLSYTALLGRNFSVTIGAQDYNDSDFSGAGKKISGPVHSDGPMRSVAFAGNAKYVGSWGDVQLMAGATPNIGMTAVSDVVTKWGYAVGAGLTIKLPMLAKGDRLNLTAAYADGALGWILNSNTSAPGTKRSLGGLLRRDYNWYQFTNGVGGSVFETTKAWQVGAMFRHYWTPTFYSIFSASYLNINPGSKTQAADWTTGGVGKANAHTLSGSLIWNPVSGLTLGGEVVYIGLNQRLAGGAAATPLATGVKLSPRAFETRLRVQRDF